MKRMMFLLLVVCAAGLTSCRKDIVVSQFVTIPSGEWAIDEVAPFDFTVADADADYRILVYVRHTEVYPYQNMWLFVHNGGQHDTIEFYLADDRGRWLGEHHHGFIEMPVLFEDHYQFADSGRYHLEIRHAMRDSVLRGVTDIGLEIVKNEQ